MTPFPVIRFDLLPSTNVTAKEYADNGALSPTIIVATRQSDGKGRNDREFSSPSGGLYMSVILRPELENENMPLITLAAGVACAEIIDKIYGLVTSLKWPNDIYIGNKKLAGILTETAPYSYTLRKIPYAIIGIGINVNSSLVDFSPPLHSIITSLLIETGKTVPPEDLIEPIVTALEDNCSFLNSDKSKLLKAWAQKDYLYGKKISWLKPDGCIIYGKGKGIDSEGRYLIKDDDNHIIPVLGGQLQPMS